MKKVFIISMLLIISICSIFLFLNKQEEQILIQDNTTLNSSSLAVYLENEDGEYESSSTIPLKDDGYVFSNAVCENDIEVKWNEEAWSIIVPNEPTFRCNLYFDKTSSATDIIEGLYPVNQEMLAYDDYDNLRYIGSNPNNYVYFNCSDYTNPSNSTCELWRIIGIFSEDTHGISNTKLVKIIRNDFLGNIAWDSNIVNNWSSASLQTTLNDDYLNGSGLYATTGIQNDETRNMIETVAWKLGGTANYTSSNNGLVSHWYRYERGTTTYNGYSTEWSGKVALMYPSDYGYATSGGSIISKATCLTTELNNWNLYSDCYYNNWLFDTDYSQWTLTLNSSSSRYVFGILNDGSIGYFNANGSRGVRPSLYLTSSVSITGGTGTSSDPYTLSL